MTKCRETNRMSACKKLEGGWEDGSCLGVLIIPPAVIIPSAVQMPAPPSDGSQIPVTLAPKEPPWPLWAPAHAHVQIDTHSHLNNRNQSFFKKEFLFLFVKKKENWRGWGHLVQCTHLACMRSQVQSPAPLGPRSAGGIPLNFLRTSTRAKLGLVASKHKGISEGPTSKQGQGYIGDILGEKLQQLGALAPLAETGVQFSASTWWLSALCNSSPGNAAPASTLFGTRHACSTLTHMKAKQLYT